MEKRKRNAASAAPAKDKAHSVTDTSRIALYGQWESVQSGMNQHGLIHSNHFLFLFLCTNT